MSSGTQTQLTDLSELVDRIYQAALDPYVWNKTLPAMAEWINAPKAMLFTPTLPPQDGGFYFNHGISESSMELWGTRYQPLDIWTTAAIQRGLIQEGLTFAGDDVVPREELIKSVWYRDFMSKDDIGQVLVNIIFGLDSKVHQPTVLSFFRNLNEIEFSVEDRWKASLLLPHISRAMGMAAQLRNAAYRLATTLTAIDRLPHGVLLIGENEDILFSNQAALRILSLEDGLRLQTIRGAAKRYLVTQQLHIQESLDNAIRQAVKPDILSAQHFSKMVVIPRPSGQAVFTLSFSSLPTQHAFAIDGHDSPKAMAFITDNDASIKIDPALLKNAYGLTKAEIRVSELIVEGKSLEEVSAKCGLSVNTLKTHLNHVYGKTNTANRAMLIKLLVTLSGNKSD